MKNTGKSNNDDKHFYFYFLYRKNCISFKNIVWRDLFDTIIFVLQFFCFAGYFKQIYICNGLVVRVF